jgi:chemotaxis protein MotB
MRTKGTYAVVVACLLSACVSRGKYDRALGVMSKYQAERLQAESDRDVAVAKMEGKLVEQNGVLAQTRDQAAKEKAAMQGELAATAAEMESVRAQRALTEQRMQEWKKLTSKLADMISAGKIKVSVREGRMLVDLPSSVLFASGSADLQDAGKPALVQVAAVLKEFPSRQFLVAGHTDNVPIGKTTAFKDNWDLSAARALTVTKFLVENGLKPRTIAAAGYGEWDPVGNNKSDTGRQQNRRIEIVLLPNIAELPKMPTTDAAGGTQ